MAAIFKKVFQSIQSFRKRISYDEKEDFVGAIHN